MNNLIDGFKKLTVDEKWLLMSLVIIAIVFAGIGVYMLIKSAKSYYRRIMQRIQDFNNEDIEEE